VSPYIIIWPLSALPCYWPTNLVSRVTSERLPVSPYIIKPALRSPLLLADRSCVITETVSESLHYNLATLRSPLPLADRSLVSRYN
jgi:hypothetical protein